MAVDEDCKNQILSTVQQELNKLPDLLQGVAKEKARQGLMDFHKHIPRQDLNFNLKEYFERHPEVKMNYPMIIPLIPDCAYKYSMQDLLDCLWKIKDHI
jgi:hypothetical protein